MTRSQIYLPKNQMICSIEISFKSSIFISIDSFSVWILNVLLNWFELSKRFWFQIFKMINSKQIVFIKLIVIFLMLKICLAKPSLLKPSKINDSKLIVISMDGLMFKQIQEKTMPFITQFYKNGVHCPNLQPVFPTKTLVNHFSIATGIKK